MSSPARAHRESDRKVNANCRGKEFLTQPGGSAHDSVLVAMLTPYATVRHYKEGNEEKHETRVWAYLLSALIALWAAFGQLFTLDRMVWLAREANNLTELAVGVFFVLMTIGLTALAVYAWNTIGRQMEDQLPSTPGEPQPDALGLGTRRRPAEEWPLL